MNTTISATRSFETISPRWLTDVGLPFALAWLFFAAWRKVQSLRSDKTTRLNGPASPSLLFGLYRHINEAEDPGAVYEEWALQHGPAFRVPGGFGSSRIVICDPRANAHFYSKETFGYIQTKLARVFIENLFGRGLLWAEGDSHRRQRKALSPAFSNAAIRKLTPIFYDAAYKMKATWDAMLDAGSGEASIDVQIWMNHISLDSVGIAGFGHDFHALDGEDSAIVDVFESFGSDDASLLSRFVFLMGPVFPTLQNLPTKKNRMLRRLRYTMRDIADELLARNRREKEGKQLSEEKSIIGLLVKAETTNSSLGMSQEEILAQMNVLLLAGYETTSISLTWALIELARKPEKQQKLRDELFQFIGNDPTFDQLSASLPYLDAVAQEVLRLHPPVRETTRVAAEDDVIPFSSPILTANGDVVSNLVISKGTTITSPITYMNRAEVFWGPNGKEFEPERWLETAGCSRAKEIQGYRHILTFSDGPRICLGKSFALTEFKARTLTAVFVAVLSVLIRNYTFQLPDGPGTKIENHRSILPRPKGESQVLITGGNFIQHNFHGPTGLELLKGAISVGASHDSAERYPPPRCHPETRIAIINSILEWVANIDRSTNVLWLYGPAGVGKSAIAQTIAEILERLRQLAATYFFSRTTPGRNHARNLFLTIAFQLSQSVVGIAPLIEEIVRQDPSIVDKSIDIQLQKLIVDPFERLSGLVQNSKLWPIAIIIDGLDECSDENTQTEILDLIANATKQLPVCFLIASRPETWIQDVFDEDPLKLITTRCELNHSSTVDEDIRNYLKAEFSRIHESRAHRRIMRAVPKPWPGKDTLDVLTFRSMGQFIYASTAVKFVDNPYYRPTDQLEKIMASLNSTEPSQAVSPFVELDKLYMQILRGSHNQDRMTRILNIIRVILLHSYTRFSAQFAFLDDMHHSDEILTLVEQLLGLRAGDAYLALRDIGSLVYLPDPNTHKGGVRFFHASFYNFLEDPGRCQKYYVDLGNINAEITSLCINIMSSPPRSDNINSYLGWIYAIYHWDYHWARSSPTAALMEDLEQFDIQIRWINVLTLTSLPEPLDFQKFRQVVTLIRVPLSSQSSSPPLELASHIDALLDLPHYLDLPSRQPTKPIFSRFMKALDEFFIRALSAYDRVDELLFILSIGRAIPTPDIFGPVMPMVAYKRLEKRIEPISSLVYQHSYMGVRLEAFWTFLHDPARAGRFFIHSDIHTKAILHLSGLLRDFDSFSVTEQQSFHRTWSDGLAYAIPNSQEVIEVLEDICVELTKPRKPGILPSSRIAKMALDYLMESKFHVHS